VGFIYQNRPIQPANQQALPNHAPEVSSKIDFRPGALQQQIHCCSRQWGKTAVIASASLRQATILLEQIVDFATIKASRPTENAPPSRCTFPI
jgi:hypothetical protein